MSEKLDSVQEGLFENLHGADKIGEFDFLSDVYEQLNFLTTGEIVFVKVENSRFYMYAINLPRKEGSLERVSTFDITQQYGFKPVYMGAMNDTGRVGIGFKKFDHSINFACKRAHDGNLQFFNKE